MFDFTWSEHTLINVLYCIFTYGLFVVLFYKRYVSNALSQSTKPNFWLIVFALLLIISACIDTDWFHYRELVYGFDFSIGASNYGEPVYGYIIDSVGQNYLLFRLVIWGAAFWLACIAFRRFDININLAVFFIVAVFLIKFNYARSTLGMACFYVGLSYLLKPIKGRLVLSLVCMALFFLGAYEFHHSMLILVLLAPLVVFLPMDKPYILIPVLLALPFLASILNDSFILVDQLDSEYLSDRLFKHLDREGTRANLYGIIQSSINYGVFLIPFVLDTVVISKKHRAVSPLMIKLYRFTISILVLAASFLFMDLESRLFVYRILYMSFIPLTILTVYLFEKQLMSRGSYRIIICWGILAISFTLLVLLYGRL